MNVSAGAEDKPWREPKDDTVQVGRTRSSHADEVSLITSHDDVINDVTTLMRTLRIPVLHFCRNQRQLLNEAIIKCLLTP